MGKGTRPGKVRFDGIDVAAMVAELSESLLGRRVINIYDGVSDADSFLVKLDGGNSSTEKAVLFMESGIRFHTTKYQGSLQQEGMPSPFASKLRKHLRGLRLEKIAQLGNLDRVVNFVFGTGVSRHTIVLELYARGNLLLTNGQYKILALLRSHEYDQVQVRVGQVYPVTYATSIANDIDGLLSMNAAEAIDWAESVLSPVNGSSPSTENEKGTPLKALLLRPSSGVYHYGPSLLEHCIVCAEVDPMVKLVHKKVLEALQFDRWENLIESLRKEGEKQLANVKESHSPGYILYRTKENISNGDGIDNQNSNRILEEFQPHLLKQHEGRMKLEYASFAVAVDEFFSSLGEQKRTLRAEAAENAAKDKLEKIRKDQQRRVESLEKEQEKLRSQAKLVQLHAEDVEKVLTVVNSALDSGMDWEGLGRLVEMEKTNGNPVADLIKRLDLERNEVVLSLEDTYGELFDNEFGRADVVVSLSETAHGNARSMFDRYRAFKEKSVKTLENSEKAMKAAEATAKKQLAEAQRKSRLTVPISGVRKTHWFEKFHWFITSDNYLVLGGKDAHQNEMLVKRYLRPGDAYLHADVHGAASCILRAKRRRMNGGKATTLPLSDQALREAGNFTICRSSAWTSRMVTSAWWVESHQVSKTAPSGEYLTVGSFMVRGKKNFLPPSQLEMGLAVVFRLGDDESINRHRNDRRDFALLSMSDNFDEEGKQADSDLKNLERGSTSKEAASPPEDALGVSPDPMPSMVPLEEHENQQEVEFREGNADKRAELNLNRVAQSLDQNELAASKCDDATKKRKGLSVRERKLVRKYGSLEAAYTAIEKRREAEGLEDKSETVSIVSEFSSSAQNKSEPLKRGKRSKMKKVSGKYADQDEEDRALAMLALHGGEKRVQRVHCDHESEADEDSLQQRAALQTTALLVKNSKEVADKVLSEDVRGLLEDCVSEGGVSRWDKFDADVLEQLASLDPEDARVAAATRLVQLKESSNVSNFSASLSGIIRTIKKYGIKSTSDVRETSASIVQAITNEEREWREALADEGVAQCEEEDDVDDTVEISKLTGKPLNEDLLLYALPVCAPYQTLNQYKYRVKLTPGNLKKGKAAKQCTDLFLQNSNQRRDQADRTTDFIKRISDAEWVQCIIGEVKISSAGSSKTVKKTKQKQKQKAKKK